MTFESLLCCVDSAGKVMYFIYIKTGKKLF